MNAKDIPQELYNKIKDRFEGTPDVQQLRTKQQYFERVGKFAQALELAKTIEELFTIALHGYIQKMDNERIAFSSESEDVPLSDKEEMMEKLTVVFMACDIIESAVVDINDILHRTKPDVNITAFNDIRQLSEMVSEKLRYLEKFGDITKDDIWADKCDNMYEMMTSKAKSIINKRKNSKDWGKNQEKYG